MDDKTMHQGQVQPDNTGRSAEAKGKSTQPGPVPYERFKEVLEKAKTLEQRLAEIEAERKKAEEERLKEEQRWRELAEKYEQELRRTKRAYLAAKVAQEVGLPPVLAERLRGETEEEMRQDAQQLAELLKAAQPQRGIPPSGGQPGGKALDWTRMSPEEIRKHAADILGLKK